MGRVGSTRFGSRTRIAAFSRGNACWGCAALALFGCQFETQPTRTSYYDGSPAGEQQAAPAQVPSSRMPTEGTPDDDSDSSRDPAKAEVAGATSAPAEGASPPTAGARAPAPPTAVAGAAAPEMEPAIPNELSPAPIHRYEFEGTGSTVRDSIGAAHGRAVNAQLQDDGVLELEGERGAYVGLPPRLLSRHKSVTLEAWVVWKGDLSRRYERIFEIGRVAGDPSDPKIGSTFFLSPNYDDNVGTRVYYRSADGEETRLFASRGFPAGSLAQVAVVLDGDAHTLTLYIDGKSAGTTPWRQSLSLFQDEDAALGRSLHPRDPTLSCTFDDFRIYDSALSAAEIERSHALGPDPASVQPK